MSEKIQMVDLSTQYKKIKSEIDIAVLQVIESCAFINGPSVHHFRANLEQYLGVKHVIPCANGTDALQIALMALDLKPGDEVIVPSFTYVATAEVIGLLRLTPVLVDVNLDDFNISINEIKEAITDKTKVIVPVHLFGQCAQMEEIMSIAREKGIYVVEDNAQAIGADFIFANETRKKSGAIGHIGCTSFFPSKNLGCYGDGGAIFTDDDELAGKLRMIANHGQSKQYYHDVIGVNSRLDSIQAAILDIKLKYLDQYNLSRKQAADYYDLKFANHSEIITPVRAKHSTHVFHQYTLRILNEKRDGLKAFLDLLSIPSGIYYPVPLNEQKAFTHMLNRAHHLPVTETLCKEVISLPMHSELNPAIQDRIINAVLEFLSK
jgi:UDP-2-acetamido-2-deoxy-ribo-hexuluronate aminotransferase